MEQSHPDLVLSEEGTEVSCDSYEHRVSVGNVGFSRGTHYWEFTVNAYTTNTDIAFGVAAKGVDSETILGENSTLFI